MEILRHTKALRARVAQVRGSGQIIGFVPTMGGLHQGHLSLVQRAAKECDVVVVSIFVNPTQFGDQGDLESYPRDLDCDAALIGEACDLLYAPSVEEVYEPGFATWVCPEGPELKGLCGASRPGHFRGVATVVTKLLNLVQPDQAFFGEKDWQQLTVIRRLATDLNIPVSIVGCPIVRSAGGLALSSRNERLSGEDRERALVLSQSLAGARKAYVGGTKQASELIAEVRRRIEEQGAVTDYVALVDGQTLQPVSQANDGSLLALAAFFGEVRLIDNHLLGRSFPG